MGECNAEKLEVRLYATIAKSNSAQRIVTGVVLRPNIVDGQGHIISEEVIQEAAAEFLNSYNRSTKLGVQHSSFNHKFQLRESYIAPIEFSLGDQVITKGSWLISVKFLDEQLWKKVEDGKIKGFSVGGRGRARKVKEDEN